MAFEKITELFTYGTLQPGQSATPKTIRGHVRDKVPGTLVERPGLPPRLFLEAPEDDKWVEGYTILLDTKELPHLDDYEGKDYVRAKVTTWLGFTVWVYIAATRKEK